MQPLVCDELPETMDKVTEIRLDALDREQRDTKDHLIRSDASLSEIGRDIAAIKEATKPREAPWWLKLIVAPLVVIGIGGFFTFLYRLDTRLRNVEGFFSENAGFIGALRLQQNAIDPTAREHVADAKRVLYSAKAGGIKIPSDVISNTGVKFLDVADKMPDAWPAAQEYLDYRSFLNADFVPSVGQLTPTTGKSKYLHSVSFIPNPQHPEWHRAYHVSFAGGYASPDKAARMERLDNLQPAGSEFALFVIDGGLDTIVLDGAYMKHVIIRNADVAYDGGAIRLEDVYFVNCTFHSRFKLTPRAIDLGRQILATTAVSFSPKA